MSVFQIKYSNGKKMMLPVADRAEYLRLRQCDEQKKVTEAARRGKTYKKRNGEEVSMKTRLQQYNYSCLPNDNGTLAKTTRLSKSVAMDIDYPGEECGRSLEVWKKEVLQKVVVKRDEVGCLMLGDSATKGFHLVFRRHADLSQEDNLRWASQVLGVPFDECAKDHTRVLFEPSGQIYILTDELFDQSECNNSVTALQRYSRKNAIKIEAKQQDKAVAAKSSAAKLDDEKKYQGIMFSSIICKYWEMFNEGNQPEEGDRNVKTYELAMTLRPICDYSVEQLMQVIPNYWAKDREATEAEAAEFRQTLENAVKEPRRGMPYRLRMVLNALKAENVSRETGGTLSTPPPIPEILPPLIALLTKNVPDRYKPAVAAGVFPSLGVHLHGVKFRYWDNVEHEGTFMNLLVGRQSVGKGCVKKPIEYILSDIVKHDQLGREREADWKRKNPSAKAKAKDPRPADICIQVLIDNLTDAVFNQRIVDADTNGHRFIYTSVDEVEALKKVTSKNSADEVSLLIRKAFDNSMAGQERVGADSVSGIAPLRWNWNASTTPPNARRFFYKAISDGTISRLDVSTIINEEVDENGRFAAPVMGIYDDEYADKLKPYLDRLDAANGLIECAQAEKLAIEMRERNADIAEQLESEAYRILSYRANVIAWLKGMVLYVAHGYKWSKEIAEFVRWSQDYNLWCKMLYFGQQLEEELQKEISIQQSANPQNLLDLLPATFSYDKYMEIRTAQGKSGDGKGTLRVWKQRGFIVWDEITNSWVKTSSTK